MIKELTKILHDKVKTHLTSYGWRAFLSMAIGICIADGKKTLKALSYLASSPALSKLFNGEDWPTKALRKLQRERAVDLIKRWYWNHRGRNPTVYLPIDGTVLDKRGEKLPKVGWHYDTRIKGLRKGQKLVLASLKVGELLLPWDFRTYLNKEKCKESDFEKSTEQAASMIRGFNSSFPFPDNCNTDVVVAVDGGLCVKEVIEAAVEEGFQLVGRIRKDRRLQDGRYARDVDSGTVARLKGLDRPVQIVHRRMEGKRETLVSTNTEITPVQVRRRMKKRWWAEKMNEELKGLGLEDCSCRGDNAVERWAGLVTLMFTLLAHLRWKERTRLGEREQWPSWSEVGEKLGVALARHGEWWENSLYWLERGIAHLKKKSPLFETLRELSNLDPQNNQQDLSCEW